MIVALNQDGQFGDDGPKSGDVGEVVSMKLIDDELWFAVDFTKSHHTGIYWVLPEFILWAAARNNESEISTTMAALATRQPYTTKVIP